MFQTIVLDNTGVVGFELQPPFDAIFKTVSNDIDRKDGPEPERQPLDVERLASEIIAATDQQPSESQTVRASGNRASQGLPLCRVTD